MRAALRLARRIWRETPGPFRLALLLSLICSLAGIGLLALSGWFVTATAAAGLAGLGIAFDVFRPSAGIRALAFGRTAARYGERLIGHQAALTGLSRLRLALFRAEALSAPDPARRVADKLNLLSADIDAVEGLIVRALLPVLAGLLALAATGGLVWALTGPRVAAALVGANLAGFLLAAALGRWRLAPRARAAEMARLALRSAGLEAFHHRSNLTAEGRLDEARRLVEARAGALRQARQRLTDAELTVSLAANLGTLTGMALTFALSGSAARAGALPVPQVLLVTLAALAFGEVQRGLSRAILDLARAATSAERIGTALALPPVPARAHPASVPEAGAPLLELNAATPARPGTGGALLAPVSLSLGPGETLQLVAPSGTGKSTLLAAIAGQNGLARGEIHLAGTPLADWPEAELRARLTFVPQRPQLLGGSLRDNLALAGDYSEAAMIEALEIVGLAEAIAPRGGLDTRLGERGAGLSGGEARRLALARALLRRPDLLLLDEPTEGLDRATAGRVLTGLREALPESAILIATHRPDDSPHTARTLQLRPA